MTHKQFMEAVIAHAREQIRDDESPFAAGIVVDNRIYIAGNKCRSTKNPNYHAEIVCINDFCDNNDPNDLSRATMYSSCEPCLMCLHSIYNAGIRKIVYGASITDAISFGSGDVEVHIKQYIKEMKLDFLSIRQSSRKEAASVLAECVNYRGEL